MACSEVTDMPLAAELRRVWRRPHSQRQIVRYANFSSVVLSVKRAIHVLRRQLTVVDMMLIRVLFDRVFSVISQAPI